MGGGVYPGQGVAERGVGMETAEPWRKRAPCPAVFPVQALGRAPGHGRLGEVR